MFAGSASLWRSLRPVWRRPLAHQPLIIFGIFLSTLVWTGVAFALCAVRFLTVVAGQTAFIGGILLCLLGLGYLGAPIGVAGLVASRMAA